MIPSLSNLHDRRNPKCVVTLLIANKNINDLRWGIGRSRGGHTCNHSANHRRKNCDPVLTHRVKMVTRRPYNYTRARSSTLVLLHGVRERSKTYPALLLKNNSLLTVQQHAVFAVPLHRSRQNLAFGVVPLSHQRIQ